MGKLTSQRIATLFHGVSRQPAHQRHPGQVEECINSNLSVERGGAEPRFGSYHVRQVPFSAATPVQMHGIDRDSIERYVVIAQAGTLRVYTDLGVERTVAFESGAAAYLAGDAERDLVFATVADFTFVMNRTVPVLLSATVVSPPPPLAILSINGARQGAFGVVLNGTPFVSNAATASPSGLQIATEVKAAIDAVSGAPWVTTLDSTNLYIRRADGADFTAAVTETFTGFATVYKDSVATTAGLPARAPNGTVLRVGSGDAVFNVKFRARSGSNEGIWEETVAPGTRTEFNAATMPHVLVREADGTFSFKRATWNPKEAGDEDTAPPPEFVGRKLSDVAFHRGRMAIVSGETVYFSRANDLFNFWPQRTTQVVDSDPFGLQSPGASVSLINWAVPYRQTLFLTSAQRQFEVTGDVLAPTRAALGAASAYSASQIARPLPQGEGLFLAVEDGNGTALLQYTYDGETLTNTADDVSRHVRGYVPAGVSQLAGDALSGTIILRAPTQLYVYSYLWSGREQLQSAWHRWEVGGAVRSIATVFDQLFLVVTRGTETCLERIPLRRPDTSVWAFRPCVDRAVSLTGVYSAGTDTTTWTLPYAATAAYAVPRKDHRPTAAIVPTFTAPSTMTARGNWSALPVLLGVPLRSDLVLSTFYMREGDAAITVGRTQIRALSLTYSETRAFTTKVEHASGLVSVNNVVVPQLGVVQAVPAPRPLALGEHRIRVDGENRSVVITLSNDTPYPHLFSSGEYMVFFNEIARQG